MKGILTDSIVVVDTTFGHMQVEEWLSEYSLRSEEVTVVIAFQNLNPRLIIEPHALTRCTPEAWRTPEEAEILGKVVGVLTYLDEPWGCARGAARTASSSWIEKAL